MVFDEKEYRKKWRKEKAKKTRIQRIQEGGNVTWPCEQCGEMTIARLDDASPLLCRKCRRNIEKETKEAKIKKDVEELRKRAGLK